ncbi:MAG: extracellular solute-binding protein [Chitinivibrionia bacterium]|nr:extracellular solute-binding protein [Chitinivibrionia bacterium]
MKMAVRVAIIVIAALAAGLVISGCGTGKPRLYVYNWVDYMPEDVIKQFQKRYGVKVVYDVFSSNEEMFAKLKISGAQYDVVVPSGDHVSMMIRNNMLQEIDRSLVPNLRHLDPEVLAKIIFDPEQKFSVPFAIGMAGITVNTAKVQDFEESWRIFENPELRGRMTLLDDMREVMGAALATLGYPINSTAQAELEEARDLIMQWRENIVRFDAETFGRGFATGEFWVVHGYAENVFLQLDDRALNHTHFFIPREGGPMYIDNMVIPANARNVELAHKFINFIHEPEIYAQIMDYFELPSINIPAREFMTEDPRYQIEDLANGEFMEDLGAYLTMYNRIWQEIRVGR